MTDPHFDVTIGIVGIGRWGTNLVRCFDDLCDIAYCCHTGNPENAARIREITSDISLTEEYEAVLADESVDAIVIATPIETHAELATKAITAGKDVFVEKPLTHTAESAKELVNMAHKRKCKLFTGYVFLYTPALQQLLTVARDDPVTTLRCRWEKFGSFDSSLKWNLTSHDIAIGHAVFDAPFTDTTVDECIGIRTETDIFDARFTTDSGAVMTTSYDRTASHTRKSIVAITESGERYEFVDDALLKLCEGTHEELVSPDEQEPLRAECLSFLNWIEGSNTLLNWIEGGNTPPTAGLFGAKVNEYLELI